MNFPRSEIELRLNGTRLPWTIKDEIILDADRWIVCEAPFTVGYERTFSDRWKLNARILVRAADDVHACLLEIDRLNGLVKNQRLAMDVMARENFRLRQREPIAVEAV